MKRLKNVFMILVLALVLTVGTKVIGARADDERQITLNVERSGKNVSVAVYVGSLSGGEIVADGDALVELKSATSTTAPLSGSGQMTAPAGEVAYLYITPNNYIEYEVSADNKYIPLVNGGYTIPADQNEVVIKAFYKSSEVRNQATAEGINGENGVTYDFNTQNMTVTGSGVYFQFMKTENTSSEPAKEKNWIPAAYKESWHNQSVIDCSGLTKTTYVAIGIMTTDAEGNTAITEVRRVALELSINKLKVVIDYKEEFPETLDEALAEIDITYADNTAKAYKKTLVKNKIAFVDGEDTFDTQTYEIQWRKGATGKWTLWSDSFEEAYQTLKASNGTLYLRAFKEVRVIDGLFSKEVKVKIAKTAKAPTVKLDYAKGTLAIKNGMEFRYNGKTYYVPATNKDATSEVRITDDATITATKTKVTALTLEEIVALFNIPDGKPFRLDIRTSATEKKYASLYYQENGLVAPSEPAGTVTAVLGEDSKGKPVLKVTFPVANKYEYYFSSVQVTDFSAVKFTATKDKTELELKSTADKNADTRKTSEPAAGQYLYYREAGNKDAKTFPSKIAYVQVPDNSTYKVTFAIASSASGATVQIKDGDTYKAFTSGTELKAGTYSFKVEKTVAEWYKILYVTQNEKELGSAAAASDALDLSVEIEVKVEDNTTVTVSVENYLEIYQNQGGCWVIGHKNEDEYRVTSDSTYFAVLEENKNIIPVGKAVTLTITFKLVSDREIDSVNVKVGSFNGNAAQGTDGKYTITIPAEYVTGEGNLNVETTLFYKETT